MPQKLKPFVKWAGGKRQLLPEIRRFLPVDISDRVYHEPFVGAGALLFDLAPQKAVINDSNNELMLAYRVIRDHAEELISVLKKYESRYSKEYYYKIRAMEDSSDFPGDFFEIEKAARFIFLNKTCYNGLYRVNSKGFFNVPVGRHKKLNICDETLLLSVSGYLNAADITVLSTDFEKAVLNAGKNSFVYFDPPYHSLKNSGFSAYQSGGFGENDHIRLRDLFFHLTETGVPCLLSNADTPFVRELYDDRRLKIIAVTARRVINSDQGGRGRVNEVLIMNYGMNQL